MFEYLMKNHDYTPYCTSANSLFDKACFWVLTTVYRSRYNERVQLKQLIHTVTFLKREELRYQKKLDYLYGQCALYAESNPAGMSRKSRYPRVTKVTYHV